MEQNTLLIFDVDGTLTYSAGLTRTAFELAVGEIYQVLNSTRGIQPFGRTDQWIFRKILENNALPVSNFTEQFALFSKVASQFLGRELAISDKPKLYDGVEALLRLLKRKTNVYLALGTGNIKENAIMKLKHHGIDQFFPIGGFGSDSEDRRVILETAYQRAMDYYGQAFERQNTWVIGDTPFDIIHGKEIMAKTVAVATGIFSSEQLKEYAPDAVFTDLTAGDSFLRLIAGNHTPE